MAFKSIDDLGDISGKTALVRVDLNVPMSDGKITDDSRIDAILPTVKDLIGRGAKVVLLSHFGRPKGQRVAGMSLKPLVRAVSDATGRPVVFGTDCIGEAAEAAIAKQAPLVLLENLRFHPGEEADDDSFASALAALGNIYINDAFSACHRAHASTHALAGKLPAAAGRSLQAELVALEKALGSPEKPVVAIVGGSKVSTKIDLMENLVTKVDHLVIGGGMANTFLAAKGVDMKASLCEHDLKDTVLKINAAAKAAGCQIHLPVDAAVAKELTPGTPARQTPVTRLEDGEMILDVGIATVGDIGVLLKDAKTLVWNGPLGAFETAPFDQSTVTLAKAAARLTQEGRLLSVAGGGDTVAALALAEVKEQFSHVSTAGGAFLEWMEGKTLPGVAALQK